MAAIHLLPLLLASFITLQPGSTLEPSEFRMLESPYGEGVMRSGRLSELARAARSGNILDPLIRFGKRGMDGAPLIRFGKRGIDGAMSPLVRFGKRGMAERRRMEDGDVMLRFGR